MSDLDDTFTVRPYHVPSVSWKLPGIEESKNGDWIHEHEVTHFHITVKVAGELEETLKAMKVVDVRWRDAGTQLLKQAKTAVMSAEDDRDYTQGVYDNKTAHGQVKAEQLYWNKKYSKFAK